MATRKKTAAKKKKTAKKSAARKKVAKKAAKRRPAARKGAAKKKTAKKKKTVARKKTATKRAAKKAKPRAKKKKSSGRKRAPNPAFMKPLTPSSQLAAVVGAGAQPRTQVISKLWTYIKRHGLQDSKNRRAINADDKLRPLFGGKSQVTMFDLAKIANKHLS